MTVRLWPSTELFRIRKQSVVRESYILQRTGQTERRDVREACHVGAVEVVLATAPEQLPARWRQRGPSRELNRPVRRTARTCSEGAKHALVEFLDPLLQDRPRL